MGDVYRVRPGTGRWALDAECLEGEEQELALPSREVRPCGLPPMTAPPIKPSECRWCGGVLVLEYWCPHCGIGPSCYNCHAMHREEKHSIRRVLVTEAPEVDR